MKLADLLLELDGKQLHILETHPIRAEKGLNRYYGEVAYVNLKEKSDKTQFIILLVRSFLK